MISHRVIYPGKYRDIQENSGTLAAIKALQTDICSRGEIEFSQPFSGTQKEARFLMQEIAEEVGVRPTDLKTSSCQKSKKKHHVILKI